MFDLKNRKMIPVYALVAAFAWGCAYPLIKLGMEAFKIDGSDTGSKTLFAGIRFTIAGLVVLGIAWINKKSFKMKLKECLWVIFFAFVNTALHYFCFYIGVSNSKGSRSSILNSLGTFMLVFFACAFFPEEKLTSKKILGCAIGFAGLVILNVGTARNGEFTLKGDGMIILNAFCSAFGGILTRIVSKKVDALVATGASLFYGGVMLSCAGTVMDGKITTVTPKGCMILFFLVCISVVGFSLYNQLIKYHSVGKVAIYNSTIPIFGVLTSCLLLSERFEIKYLFAGIFVAIGVFVLNYEK